MLKAFAITLDSAASIDSSHLADRGRGHTGAYTRRASGSHSLTSWSLKALGGRQLAYAKQLASASRGALRVAFRV